MIQASLKKSKLKFLVFFKMITQSANIDKVYNYIVCKVQQSFLRRAGNIRIAGVQRYVSVS